MIVLQIIFPIPVIMSLDPTSKDNKVLKFFTEYFKIYGQVFIRVATIQLGFVVLAYLSSLF